MRLIWMVNLPNVILARKNHAKVTATHARIAG